MHFSKFCLVYFAINALKSEIKPSVHELALHLSLNGWKYKLENI